MRQHSPSPHPRRPHSRRRRPINSRPRRRLTGVDNLPDAKADKQTALRSEAVEKLVSGKSTAVVKGKSKVVAVGKRADGKTQYAQVAPTAATKTDPIFTILTDFGTQIDPRTGGAPGPLNNEIAEPNRRNDNSTNWSADFSREHYLDMFYGQGQGVVRRLLPAPVQRQVHGRR